MNTSHKINCSKCKQIVCCASCSLDVAQGVVSAVSDDRDHHAALNGCVTAAVDRAAAMFAAPTTTASDQYQQFVRLQQLLMHLQTGAMLQQAPDNSTAQVNYRKPKRFYRHTCPFRQRTLTLSL